GCLGASLLLVVSGKLPWIFIVVGAARYLFVAGVWIRSLLKLPVHPLRHTVSGRILAAIAMNYMAVAMAPIVPRVAALAAMPIVALPFLAGFVRDFYAVAGGNIRGRVVRRTAE